MSDEQLYYRAGRRYYPAHTTLRHSFPVDGIWIVQGDCTHGRQIARVGDVPDPMHLASVERYRDAICRAFQRDGWRWLSIDDIATLVIRAIEKETRER